MPEAVTTLTTTRPTTVRYIGTDENGDPHKSAAEFPAGVDLYRGLDAVRDGERYVCLVAPGTYAIVDADAVNVETEGRADGPALADEAARKAGHAVRYVEGEGGTQRYEVTAARYGGAGIAAGVVHVAADPPYIAAMDHLDSGRPFDDLASAVEYLAGTV